MYVFEYIPRMSVASRTGRENRGTMCICMNKMVEENAYASSWKRAGESESFEREFDKDLDRTQYEIRPNHHRRFIVASKYNNYFIWYFIYLVHQTHWKP